MLRLLSARSMRRLIAALLIVGGVPQVAAQVTVSKSTNFSVHAAADGRLATDLLGSIWIIPPAGGDAQLVAAGSTSAHRPRWSPDAGSILYQVRSSEADGIWLHDVQQNVSTRISEDSFYDQHPNWHPDGERIVFSSDRRETQFDLWERDMPTGLTWRISSLAGDETEPAWSADGRDLLYIHHADGIWSILLRRQGQAERLLVRSSSRLSSPSWRPDGSLITFLRHDEDGLSIDMIILSDPPLIRPLISGEDFFVAPVAWLDRHQLLYTANGLIRTRLFDSWTSTNIPFRARVQRDKRRRAEPRRKRLPDEQAPPGQLVLRTARLYDGVNCCYRHGLDIVIENGRIKSLESRRERPGARRYPLRAMCCSDHCSCPTV